MFYVLVQSGRPLEITAKIPGNPGCGTRWVKRETPLTEADGWMSSRDFRSYPDARSMAQYLTAMTGRIYLPVDEGDGVWPRYRIIEAPTVGQEVSKSFNGDSYPCGKITKITKSWRVTTDDGHTFRRYKETGGWRETGRGFWMISGHHYEQNPHF